MQQGGELQISSERIRQLVEREGKAARNLLTWSVPAVNGQKPRDRRQRQAGRGVERGKTRARGGRWKSPVASHRDSGIQDMPSAASEEMCVAAAGQYSHSSRGEGRRGPTDLQARYWSYLFDNLHRAVDELYCTCEADESVVECQVGVAGGCGQRQLGLRHAFPQEVMMTLDVCRRDFEALISRIKLQRDFEQTDSQNR